MFALQLLVSAGIKVIITSSSDNKLASVKKLSPLIQGINYKTHSDVAAEALHLTGGRGVDIVVNNAGEPSVPSNIASLATRGTISMVGFLGGSETEWKPGTLLNLMFKLAKIQ
jgi:NADPH:quinone reductase-like Zn-dependent oxidoreductase